MILWTPQNSMDWRIHGLMRYFVVFWNVSIMIIFIMLGYIDENSCLSTVGPFDNLVYEFCVLKHLVYAVMCKSLMAKHGSLAVNTGNWQSIT